MGTIIRPELSEKNKYWIERHRYYELKHFCLQYPIWKKVCLTLDGFNGRPADLTALSKTNAVNDPVGKCAEERDFYLHRMNMIEQAAIATDSSLHGYILKAVIEGLSYDLLKARLEIPCCKDAYYELYRRFFWLLDKARR